MAGEPDLVTDVDALLAAVKTSGMEGRVTIQGFDWRALQRVQQLAPGLPTAYLCAQAPRFDTIADGAWTAGYRLAEHGTVPKMVKAAGGTIWSPNFHDLTAHLVEEAHALVGEGHELGAVDVLEGHAPPHPTEQPVLGQGRRAGEAVPVELVHDPQDLVPGAQVGDEVVFLGTQEGPLGRETITATEIAELSGTIPWEVLTSISRRVPRFYREP